jgi:sugar/nucleoside kinase (ribokinase family)
MEKPFDAVAAGHICLDVIPSFPGIAPGEWERLFAPGRLVEAGPVTLSTGGPVSNTGLALRKLGIDTLLMGKIGDDLFGEAVQHLAGGGATHTEEGMIVDPEADTSYTIVVSPPGVDRMFLHCPGANATFGADDVRYDAVSQSRLFHFGYPPLMERMYRDEGAELVEMLRRVKEDGVTTSLDMALPDPTSAAGRADWNAILGAALPYVDVFLPSVEETLFMLRRETYEKLSQRATEGSLVSLVTTSLLLELSDQVLEMGAAVVGFKLGDRGLYVRTGTVSKIKGLGSATPSNPETWADRELWAPCFEADLVGTTGAGDATIAGFLSALLWDVSLPEAITTAVAVGACNVEAADALSGVRSWEETQRRIEKGWERLPLSIEADDWRLNQELGLWIGPG